MVSDYGYLPNSLFLRNVDAYLWGWEAEVVTTISLHIIHFTEDFFQSLCAMAHATFALKLFLL